MASLVIFVFLVFEFLFPVLELFFFFAQDRHLHLLRYLILLDNLFYDKRYGDDDFWFHIGECLEDNLRTWHTGEEVDVTTYGELIKELNRAAWNIPVYLNMQTHKMACLYDRYKDENEFGELFIPRDL